MGTSRILIGNRSTGGYGLYVSKTGDEVTNTSNPLAFDSRTGTGWSIKQAGQYILGAGNTSSSARTINHGLGYNPLFAVRWCTSSQISSGVATKVYSPSYVFAVERDTSVPGELDIEVGQFGVRVVHGDTNNLVTINLGTGGSIYVSYIIFNEPDFTGGKGL
tara:strand:+ start:126 stop:611 length:486 start_codon:yes stop_codon:yes gene_type:complete